MEKYMSESYDGRTFVELIQNADDAQSSAVRVFSVDDTLIVANTGRPFNEADIMAICRSGSSNKQRGTSIGYRGVGFKSATTISSEIVIYSGGAYFTFSKELCAKTLGKTVDRVPTVRIPFPYEEKHLSAKVSSAIEGAEADGFTTFFIFLHANIRKFITELEGFNSGWLLFLKNISKVELDLLDIRKTCKVSRKTISEQDSLVKIIGGKEQWYIVTDGAVSLAFKYDERGIVPCSSNDSSFHCFLPTMDKTGYPFKVNADFSTDPSRKHLILDDMTKQALERITRLYASFVTRVMISKDEKLLVAATLINSPLSLSELASELEKGILQKLRQTDWVTLNSGAITSPENTHILPSWLTADEQDLLVSKVPSVANSTPQISLLRQVEKLDKFLVKLGAKDLPVAVLSGVLKQIDSVSKLEAAFIGKIFVYSCRGNLSNRDVLQDIFIPITEGKYGRIADISESTQIDTEFLAALAVLSSKEKTNLADSFPVFSCLLRAKPVQQKAGAKISLTKSADLGKKATLAINKWKTPIQNCIAVEALNGWTAKDVSRKNTEYSVRSTNTAGQTRYLAVKKIDILGDSFKLSESEYSAAQRLGDSFELFIIATEGSEIEYAYIKNPLETLELSKVVKEWEWCCDRYSVESEVTGDAPEMIDDNFLRNMSREFLNSQQLLILQRIADKGTVILEQKELIIVNQINSISDFYTSSPVLKINDNEVCIMADKVSAVKKLLSDK
ncbi:MAG: ATP-binding protein [Firmicutes bacterium]|nr:ATP-binding protein [Bacillota bacterium]